MVAGLLELAPACMEPVQCQGRRQQGLARLQCCAQAFNSSMTAFMDDTCTVKVTGQHTVWKGTKVTRACDVCYFNSDVHELCNGPT